MGKLKQFNKWQRTSEIYARRWTVRYRPVIMKPPDNCVYCSVCSLIVMDSGQNQIAACETLAMHFKEPAMKRDLHKPGPSSQNACYFAARISKLKSSLKKFVAIVQKVVTQLSSWKRSEVSAT